MLLNTGVAGGKVESLRRRLGAAFAAHGVPFDIVETSDKEEGLRITRAASKCNCRAVVVAGGDGTVSVALRGTAGMGVPVAIIPLGTGNQLAHNFAIPDSLEDSVRVAVEGRVTEVDLGLVNGEHFALIAGAGLDADIMAGATPELKSRFGIAAYLYSGVKNVIAPPDTDFLITADGKEAQVRASVVLLANAAQLGTGRFPMEFTMAPETSFQDGLLDVCVFAPRNLPDAVSILWRVSRKRFDGEKGMIFFQAQAVRIETDPPVAVQIDGEMRGETPIEAEIEPLAARILVPR